MKPSLPYPSNREPVYASNVVATSHPLASQAGIDILKKGGNAVDAAIATAITLTVVEPCANGIGSDAFAIVKDGDGLHGINGSGKSPALMPNEIEGDIPSVGWLPITVPGAVSTWSSLHERFGVLPFEALFESAIHYASNGFLLSPQTAVGFERGAVRYASCDEWKDTFLVNGEVPEAGTLIKLPHHAETLKDIASTHGDSFYRGALAEEMHKASIEQGGYLRKEDLKSHQPVWVDPISINVDGHVFSELPPNGQGIAALIALKILQKLDIDLSKVDEPEVLHAQIEAMKCAFADTHAFVADPDCCGRCEALLDDARIEKHAHSITTEASGIREETIPTYSSTVYLAVGDANGMQVSFIQSNFEGFGSGVVIPNTGIAMQNRGRGFSTDASHPNAIGPLKRPFHTIIPAFIELAQGGNVPMGVMGGPMQPQGHVQVACRLLFAHQNPQAALDAPRWRVDAGRTVHLESGFDAKVYAALKEMGHDVKVANERTVQFGGGQVVYQVQDGYVAGSDSRRDGQAIGF
ncbi:MAG: gamma-glutamyltransferase [Phycisphaerae bacterium]|nr:gamma-glutamyltransferase [Phycisphaerae bacterium]